MSWLRTDDGFSSHPKFAGWKPSQKWAFLELMHYCARYRTEGQIPADLALLPRGVDARLLTLAEQSGWIDRDAQNRMFIHDWAIYNPKDVTAASRSKAYRDRNANRNANRDEDRDATRNGNGPSRAGTRRTRPVLKENSPRAVNEGPDDEPDIGADREAPGSRSLEELTPNLPGIDP